MSGYKDDLEAAHERIQSHEREVSRLRAEDKAGPAVVPKPAGAARLGAGLVLMAAGGLGLVGTVLFFVLPDREAPLLLATIAAAAVFGLIFFAVAGRFMIVLRPWQAAIVSGMGSRVVTSGRLIRLPVVQQVYVMDLRAHLVEWSLDGVFALGGVPVDARGYLAFAIRPLPPDVARAAEHFLGRSPSEIEQVVRQAVEQAVRAVIARLTPDELSKYREKFNAEAERELRESLEKLGMDALSLGLLEASVTGGRR